MDRGMSRVPISITDLTNLRVLDNPGITKLLVWTDLHGLFVYVSLSG